MGAHGSDPLQSIKDLLLFSVFRLVNDFGLLWNVGHSLLGERCTDNPPQTSADKYSGPDFKRIYWGLNSCLALGIMARPGATWPEYYVVAVILRRTKIQNWVHGRQVWAREWWNNGMLVLKEVCHLLTSLAIVFWQFTLWNFPEGTLFNRANRCPSPPEPIIIEKRWHFPDSCVKASAGSKSNFLSSDGAGGYRREISDFKLVTPIICQIYCYLNKISLRLN